MGGWRLCSQPASDHQLPSTLLCKMKRGQEMDRTWRLVHWRGALLVIYRNFMALRFITSEFLLGIIDIQREGRVCVALHLRLWFFKIPSMFVCIKFNTQLFLFKGKSNLTFSSEKLCGWTIIGKNSPFGYFGVISPASYFYRHHVLFNRCTTTVLEVEMIFLNIISQWIWRNQVAWPEFHGIIILGPTKYTHCVNYELRYKNTNFKLFL